MLEFNWSLVLIIINMVVLCALMKKFLIGPVMDVIEKRQNLIEEQLTHADTVEKNAFALKEKWEITMKNMNEESKELRKDAEEKAKQEYERIICVADLEATRIKQDAQQNILMEREKMLEGVRSEITGLAMDMAMKVVSDSNTEQISALMYDQFLKKEGGADDTIMQ